MLLKDKKVAIIGAGPVGLTMAILLQRKGINVTVYERDKDPLTRISGGTLDLHKGSGQEAMREAGLLERYYVMAISMGRIVVDKEGTVLLSKTPTPAERYDNPEINRNDLRKLLLESLTTETVVWNRKFRGLTEQNGKWVLHFEHERDTTADLVIGANGGMSRARKYVTDAAIEFTGTIILQGEVHQPEINCPEFFQLCNDSILMTASDGNLLVANPKNGSLLSYNVMFKKPDDWETQDGSHLHNTNSIIAFLSDKLTNWASCYKQLFRATSSFVIWPTRRIPMDKPWNDNRPLPITLIGDTAHIMPPFAGQGVNIGLMDALILSNNLTSGKHVTIKAAIRDYEQQMIVYATEAQLETRKNELAMIHPSFTFEKIYQ